MICGLYAISAVTGLPLDTVIAKATEAGMIQKIAQTGSAATEIKRLLGLFGFDANTEYPDGVGTLRQWMASQEYKGIKATIYCVRQGQGYHAVAVGPGGYSDNLRPLLEGRVPKKGISRKVRWLVEVP